jgi:AAHS family 4-hydroxybenzoate transporter-like MFS transporter
MPNATTLFSEYCPNRIRSLLVTCMFCGYNLGMATGGFISSWLIPTLVGTAYFYWVVGPTF